MEYEGVPDPKMFLTGAKERMVGEVRK